MVEVYDTNFMPVSMSAGAFTDPMIPAGFAPFNVLNIDGNPFVSFVMQEQPDRKDEVDGAGLGYVDVFDGSGVLLSRLQQGKWMDAPWGMVHAQQISANGATVCWLASSAAAKSRRSMQKSGAFQGLLRGSKGKPIKH